MTTQNDSEPPRVREGGVRTIEDLRGPAGRLEALLNPGAPDASTVVLLCHPHPLYGGTLHNKVVYHAMKTFTELGLPVLRFNFRGTGRSEGLHDAGVGEQEDVRAGLDWLSKAYDRPILAAGFSFGAHMALRAGCADPRVSRLVSLGTPIAAADRAYTYEFLTNCHKPKLFLSGAADAFGAVTDVEAAIAPAPAKQISWIAEGDHFFVGKLDQMQAVLRDWVGTQLAATEPHKQEESDAAR